MSTPDDIQQTVDLLKGVYASGPDALAPDVVKDFTTSLGLVPYNLQAGAKLLSPVITPVRNTVPRVQGYGKATEFKAITSYNATSASSFAAEGVSGNVVSTTVVDVLMPYKIQSLKNNVTFEAQYFGRGQVDAKALATANLLRAFLIQEENNMLFGVPSTAITGASAGGQAVSIGGALGASAAPTAANAATGGTVGAGTYNVVQTAVTGMGEGLPSTAANTTTTGATSTLTLTPTTVPGALFYNLYYKLSTDATYVKATTNGKPIVATSYAIGAATLPGVDNSASSLAYPGVLAQLLASGSGATVNTINRAQQMGTATTFGDIDNLFLNMWNNGKADPDWIVANAFESLTITGGTLGAGTPYFVQPDGQPQAAVGGFRVSRLTNKVTGKLADIQVHPTMPQGTLLALSFQLPAWYPGSDIPSVWSMEMSYDYLELDYPPTAPTFPIEVRNAGALLCHFPLLQGVLLGISAS